MENLKAKGKLRLSVYQDGVLIREEVGDNLIVESGLTAIAYALAGTTGYAITTFGAGGDGTEPGPGDTDLLDPLFSKAIAAISVPVPATLVFDFAIGAGEGNGNTYTEWGLFADNGDLFARKTAEAIEKTALVSIEGQWTITFTAS